MKTPTHPSFKVLFNAALVAGCLLGAPRAHAQSPNPPALMTYQGYLVNANGVALGQPTPKNYDVIFRIYDSANGTSVQWAEQQTVTVDNGNFSVLLGEGSSIGEVRPALNTVFDGATASDRYIGITVKGIGAGGADANILPRLRLLTSPYSYLAQKAMSIDGAAVTSGTVADPRLSANVALRAGGNVFTGNQQINANLGLGVNPTFPLQFANNLGDKISLWANGANTYGFGIQGSQLQIHASGSGDDITFGYGSSAAMTERMRIKGNGNVGIGVDPTSRFHVAGGDIQINGGGIYMDNQQSLIAKNSAGAWENCLIPRWSDNITYLTYGAGGLNIRNNSSNPSMFLQNNGRVGIGTSTLAPGRLLQVGSQDINGSEGMIRFGSRSPSGGSARTWDIGVPQTLDVSVTGPGYSFVVDDPGINSGPEMCIRWNNGYVGFNTTAPPFPLTVQNDGNTAMGMTRSDGKYAYFGRNGNALYLALNSSVWSAGERYALYDGDSNWDFGSDRKLKKDIVDVESVFDRAMQVRVRRFRWKDDAPGSKHMLGVIAQELQPLFPEMVGEMESPSTHEKSLTVGYGDFAVIAIKALQEFKKSHDEELATLKSQIAELEKQNKELLSKDKERDKRLSAIEDMLRSQSRPEVKQAAFVIDGK